MVVSRYTKEAMAPAIFMAIDILSIPAISAEPEGIFSGAHRTISWDRAQLSSAVTESTERLKNAIRNRIVEDEDGEEEF